MTRPVDDVVVTAHAGGWAVRHPRRLYERFESRTQAVRVAVMHARRLSRPGEPCAVRKGRHAPERTPRDHA